MNRSSTKYPRKPAKQMDSLPRNFGPAVAVMRKVSDVASVTVTKTPDRIEKAIRQSAKGEECTVRIPGVCTFNPETTIWSHAPLGAAGKGRSIKAADICGAYCCTACDAAIDGQMKLPEGMTRDMALLDWFHGHMRSLVLLRQKGLV